jgi:hypothetical protein
MFFYSRKLALLAFIISLCGRAHAAEICPFVTERQLAAAMPEQRWSLISNQDGRGCIFMDGTDTLMLSVFRNPSADRAKDLYVTFRKTLSGRMTLVAIPGIGDETYAGATGATEKTNPEAAVITLSGDYIVSISLRRSGQPAENALLAPLSVLAGETARNSRKSSEKFNSCEWLSAADAAGFLDESTLTIQRTGPNSCLMYGGSANTLMVAVTAAASETVMNMKNRSGGCQHVPLPEFGKEAFGEHSCKSGNTNAASIHVWKSGQDAWIVFAPTKSHPESGSVDRLKEVAARVYAKL